MLLLLPVGQFPTPWNKSELQRFTVVRTKTKTKRISYKGHCVYKNYKHIKYLFPVQNAPGKSVWASYNSQLTFISSSVLKHSSQSLGRDSSMSSTDRPLRRSLRAIQLKIKKNAQHQLNSAHSILYTARRHTRAWVLGLQGARCRR